MRVFGIADYNPAIRFKKFEMADIIGRIKFLKNWYMRVSKVAGGRSTVRFKKFEMAELIWQMKF